YALWCATKWRCCADGGTNRLRTVSAAAGVSKTHYLPDLINGDLDSITPDVHHHYTTLGVPIVRDNDQDSTGLIKCLQALEEHETKAGCVHPLDLILLGGLAGRLDQTIHVLSFLHKRRASGCRRFAVTNDNVAWVLDTGNHHIHINHAVLGPTCGILPVGISETILTTKGLRQWN
ncbi:Thiamin pyrophosphokinase, partial [Fistulina hepatica ATCC 64428]